MDPLLTRITLDPAVCHGKPCVRGLRPPVATLLELLSAGMTRAAILADSADLEPDDLLEAPDLLAPLTGGNYTTYFVKQPQTPEEVERACNAIQVCCVMDLRYGGTDRTIIQRLGNDPVECDYVIQDGQLVLSDKARTEPDGVSP